METREAEVADLSDCLARLSIEVKGRGARVEGLARQKAAQDAKLEEMRRELAAKDELVSFQPYFFVEYLDLDLVIWVSPGDHKSLVD